MALIGNPFRPASDVDASGRNACVQHGQMVTTGRYTGAARVDDPICRSVTEEGEKLLLKDGRRFKDPLHSQIVTAGPIF